SAEAAPTSHEARICVPPSRMVCPCRGDEALSSTGRLGAARSNPSTVETVVPAFPTFCAVPAARAGLAFSAPTAHSDAPWGGWAGACRADPQWGFAAWLEIEGPASLGGRGALACLTSRFIGPFSNFCNRMTLCGPSPAPATHLLVEDEVERVGRPGGAGGVRGLRLSLGPVVVQPVQGLLLSSRGVSGTAQRPLTASAVDRPPQVEQ